MSESNRKEIQFTNDATVASHFKKALKRLDNRFALAWRDFGPTKSVIMIVGARNAVTLRHVHW